MTSPRPIVPLPRLLGGIVVLLLAALALLRSSIGTQLDGFTVDEPWHIVAGTAYVRGGERHLNPEHPPLVKLWVGAAMPEDFRLGPEPELREKAQEREWVERTMFLDNDANRAQQRSRIAMWGFHGLLLAALGVLLWRAAGFVWAVGTLAFLALEPTIAAYLPVVMTDGPLALMLACAVVAAGILAATWQWRWVAITGTAAGLALGTKHSALAGLLGVWLVLVAGMYAGLRHGGLRELLRRSGQLLACAALAIVVLWAQYGFRFHADRDGGDAFNRALDDKIVEVATPSLRGALEVADRLHLLPRAYLWGLADTVRTGVEGRGWPVHLVWGHRYEGRTPWFTWPAILAAKLPLALSALALLGVALLWRTPLPATARWMLAAVLAASAMHLAVLAVSPAAWGGVRHAAPLIAAAAVLGGGAVAEAWRRRSRMLLAGCAGLLVSAFAMTIREPRLWEYHNELAGGSANAWRYFSNEGLDLGQRFNEIRTFHDREIASSGQPLYSGVWLVESQIRAARLAYRPRVETLDDTNVEGVYEGWFVYANTDRLPLPQTDWDPEEVFKELTLAAQLGNVGIWRGRQVRPKTRASSLAFRVMEYLYKEDGEDWALVARRLEEVAALMPYKVDAGVELGNAYLRLGQRDAALAAYRRLLEQKKLPLDAKVAGQLRAHIARIESGEALATIEPMRNPWME